jgi:predicted CoA-binding protein
VSDDPVILWLHPTLLRIYLELGFNYGGLNAMPNDDRKQPDLRTLEGQLDFLDYHRPDAGATVAHEHVNQSVQNLWSQVNASLPEGPGKTRALHALNHARMEMNNCIANLGA